MAKEEMGDTGRCWGSSSSVAVLGLKVLGITVSPQQQHRTGSLFMPGAH